MYPLTRAAGHASAAPAKLGADDSTCAHSFLTAETTAETRSNASSDWVYSRVASLDSEEEEDASPYGSKPALSARRPPQLTCDQVEPCDDEELSHTIGHGIAIPCSPLADESGPNSRRALLALVRAEAQALAAAASGTSCNGNPAVRRQLRADACRARYMVDGTEFWFEKEIGRRSLHGAEPVENASQAEASTDAELKGAFVGKLLGAVEKCLGVDANETLLEVVLLLFTQIVFSLVHVACGGPQFALCGGQRKVSYDLMRIGKDQWQLRGQFCAHGFGEYQACDDGTTSGIAEDDRGGGRQEDRHGAVIDDASASAEAGPHPCSTASSVHRGFVLLVRRCPRSPGGVSFSVRDAFEDISIFSTDGLPVVLTACQPQHTPRDNARRGIAGFGGFVGPSSSRKPCVDPLHNGRQLPGLSLPSLFSFLWPSAGNADNTFTSRGRGGCWAPSFACVVNDDRRDDPNSEVVVIELGRAQAER